VARVGAVAIAPSEVAWVANAKGLPPREALDELVADALAAQGAPALGLDATPAVSWERTAAVARQVPLQLARAAAEKGAPSDDELASVVVVHAVVLRSATLREEDALALARSIRQTVAAVRTPDDFLARAQAVPHPHASVVAERLGPFAADGVGPGGATLDPGFVAAAFALRAPLELSSIVVTPFGWHVLQLVERRPPSSPSEADALRVDLAESVRDLRARMALDSLIRMRRGNGRVETSVAADELLARAVASP
jgi:hypothetical protein